MDKPVTLSIKNWLIRNMSVKTMTPESTIELVINHQFNSAYEALKNCYSLEFSGFGKFYFKKKRAEYKMRDWLDIKKAYENMLADNSISEQKRQSTELKLKSVTKDIETLKPKLDECTTDNRRVEEPPYPSRKAKKSN